ncbi:hypothetical protein [Chitinophaga rhizophila]|uniref:HTH cro/C1-type domain-containing protein n=1 Tax=Chitinophaga rhizophila TaxID=2866212 RepID=A0ABS7G9U9_9BACT|nr:hypothetical protein [Chitinophaga rhizophila]MBW8683308.1 hypothetical protein [Chitinophaga rhizophila]
MKNLFREMLIKLIDDTKVLNRTQWSQYLMVSEAAISQWLTGKTFPKSEHLRNILSYLNDFEDAKIQDSLYDFYEMSNLPVTESLPEDQQEKLRGVRSISDYINLADFYAFQVELSRVHGALKKEFIYLCTEFARSLKEFSSVNSERSDIRILRDALLKIENAHINEFFSKFIQEKVPELEVAEENPIEIPRDAKCSGEESIGSKIIKPLHNLKSIYRMDAPNSGPEYKCEIFMLHFDENRGQKIEIPEIEAEEIVFYKIGGECEWIFKDSETLDFRSNNIGWLKCNQKLDSKAVLPKSQLNIHKSGYGVLILYNESGIKFESGFNSEKSNHYSHSHYFDYYINKLPSKKVDYISLFKTSMSNAVFDLNKFSNTVWEEIYLNSIFEKWPAFRESVISLKLINVPAHRKKEKAVRLSSHYGYEIIIPIYSSLNILTYQSPMDNNNHEDLLVNIDSPEVIRTEINGLHKAGCANLYVLNCEVPHYFYGGDQDTICLNFKIKRHTVTNAVDGNLIIKNPIVDIDNPNKFYEKTILRDNFVG